MSEAFVHNKEMIEKYENIDTIRVSVSDDKVRHHIHENPDVYNIKGTTKLVEKKSKKRDKNFLLITLAIVVPVVLLSLLYWFIKTMS